jgi:hypothetical protein
VRSGRGSSGPPRHHGASPNPDRTVKEFTTFRRCAESLGRSIL